MRSLSTSASIWGPKFPFTHIHNPPLPHFRVHSVLRFCIALTSRSWRVPLPAPITSDSVWSLIAHVNPLIHCGFSQILHHCQHPRYPRSLMQPTIRAEVTFFNDHRIGDFHAVNIEPHTNPRRMASRTTDKKVPTAQLVLF